MNDRVVNAVGKAGRHEGDIFLPHGFTSLHTEECCVEARDGVFREETGLGDEMGGCVQKGGFTLLSL